jgi:nucleoside phosphorylase/tetratricopeptide (TPR) repeat protein
MGLDVAPGDAVDVLIVTAVPIEYDAVLQVETGAWRESTWEVQPGPTQLNVAFRTFGTTDGRPLRVAVTRTLEMGGVAAANAAAPLVTHYKPRCVAMCGVCAGRRGKVELGDVIVADRLWQYDTGKAKADEDAQGKRVERVQGDITTHLIRPVWKQAAENFLPPETERWLRLRPRSYEQQEHWLLERLLGGEDPSTHAECEARCAQFEEVLESLWSKGWLVDGTLTLTAEGRRYIDRLRLKFRKGLPDPKPFKVHVGPIGSGNKVMEDPQIFAWLSESVRTVQGLEMEAAAIGAVAHLQGVPYLLVMKGVMDFADGEKNDHFKAFAARASAECLIAFLRQHWPVESATDPPRGTGAKRAGEDDFGDVLASGMAAKPPGARPAALLNARHEVVDFYEPGRASLLEELKIWAEGEAAVSARLVHGAGGMGKTRLFITWCKRLREVGWRAGFVRKNARPERLAALVASEGPALVVVDYAEMWPGLGDLLQQVARRHKAEAAGRLRVVLLARAVGDWWADLCGSDTAVKDLLVEYAPLCLEPLAHGKEEREHVFRAALASFAAIDKKDAARVVMPPLEDERYDRVLYLHMAALRALQGEVVQVETLLEDTLDHEARFWLERLPIEDRNTSRGRLFKKRVAQALAALTLTGGAEDHEQAQALMRRVLGEEDEELVLLLRDLYPDERQGSHLGSLEPDLLGEALVHRVLSPAGGWRGVLRAALEDAGARAIETGLVVLGRLSVRYPEEAGTWIDEVLSYDIADRALPALAAAKILGERTAHAAVGVKLALALAQHGTIEVARRLAHAGIPEETVSLREVGAWVTQMELEHLPQGTEEAVLAKRAWLLNNLSIRQSKLGQREAALESTQQAVDIRRKLAQTRPDAFLLDLAICLNNLGNWQSQLGLREKALESTQQSVDILHKLAQIRPDAFLPDLASCLNNLGNRQSELRLREEALKSTQQAVDIHRKIAQTRPDAFLPGLASCLNNLGIRQSELEQREEALKSTRQAVDIYRKIAQTRPDAFLPDLASCLNNLGIRQSKLGQREEALESTQQAVDIRRKLAQTRPNAFLPDLARSLGSLGTMQSEMGRWEAALASSQEALNHIWPFFLTLPEAFGHLTQAILRDVRRYLQTLGCPPTPELQERLAIFEERFSH